MRNKTNIETIDKTQPVALDLVTEALGNFTIQGSYEDVAPYLTASHTEAPQAPSQHKSHDVASYALEPVRGIRANVTAITYDVLNGTHFYDALRQQRQLRKDLAMAQSLGLLAVPVCAKHREQLEAVKSVR